MSLSFFASSIQPDLPRYRLCPDLQRTLDPQCERLLRSPVAALIADFKIKLEYECGQDESHLMHSHILPKAITGSEPEGLMSVQGVSRVQGIGLQPTFRGKRSGVFEVGFGLIRGPVMNRYACPWWNPLAENDLPPFQYHSWTTDWNRGIYTKCFFQACYSSGYDQ